MAGAWPTVRPAASPLARLREPSLAGIAHAGALLAAGVLILWLDRDRWFLYDEWAFPALIHPLAVQGHWAHFLLAPYINHWIGIPNLVWELLYRSVGMRAYLPYLLPTLISHLAVVALLRAILIRAGVGAWPATLACLPLLLTGAGAGNLAFGWQIEFLGAAAFGLGQLLLTDHEGPVDRRDVVGLGLGLLGLMCSGVAPAFVFLVGASLALRRRWTAALLATVPLAVVFLAWYVVYGHQDLAGQPPPTMNAARLAAIPGFIWTGLTASLEGLLGIPRIGGVAVLLLAGAALALRLWPTRQPGTRAWAAAAAALAFFALVGYGRADNGPSFATQSRYLYVGILLLLPLVALVAERTLRNRATAGLWLAILAWAVAANLVMMITFIHSMTVMGEQLRGEVYRVTGPEGSATDPRQAITTPGAMWMTVGLVRQLKSEGDL